MDVVNLKTIKVILKLSSKQTHNASEMLKSTIGNTAHLTNVRLVCLKKFKFVRNDAIP